MGLRIAGGVFTFRLVPTLTTLLLIIILIGLGTWQVQRAAWKENLIATIEVQRHTKPIDLAATKNITIDPSYRPAFATGQFLYDKTLYMSAISLKGEGGYHVLTPLKLTDGRRLIVNRGFVPYDKKQAVSEPKGKVKIAGILRVPVKAGWSAPANQPATNVWYSIDLRSMALATGVPAFLPYVLDVQASDPTIYPIGGQTRFDLPNNHRGYALTWYSLAFVLLVIYGLSSWQPRKKKQ